MYYWYRSADDLYIDYATTDQEISELESELGVAVDGNPGGGTLVEDGYINSIYPHNTWAAILLYAHY